MADHQLTLVDRTPQQTAAPTLTPVGPLPAPTITYTDALNSDGTLKCSVVPRLLDNDVKTALRDAIDPSTPPDPLELHLHRDGTLVWAGPLVGGQIQGGTISLDGRSLSYYLHHMWVTADLTFTDVDQHTIAASLIDHWQNLDWGDYGIDTTAVTASGVTRRRTYLAAEHPNIHEQVARLGQVIDGYDWWIDPDRQLHLTDERGSDLTSAVVFDLRNVADPGIAFLSGADDIASEAFGLATSVDSDPLTSVQSDTSVRQTFGRAGVAATFDGVTRQATLDGHTSQFLQDRVGPKFDPGPELIPVADVGPGDFGPGDTVEWSFDAGLGVQTFPARLSKVQVTIGEDGGVSMKVGML